MDSFELNVGTVKYEGKGVLINQGGANFLGTAEKPIVVHVDTDTDWPTIIPAGAGVVVAILVAWMTVRVQKNQIQGNISNLRHHWMAELREAAAELIQCTTYMVNMSSVDRTFKYSPEYYQYCARSSQLRAKVELLLSRDDARAKQVRDAGSTALRGAVSCKHKQETGPLLEKISIYKNLLRRELEMAWADTKRDLGIDQKLFFIRLFKNKKSDELL